MGCIARALGVTISVPTGVLIVLVALSAGAAGQSMRNMSVLTGAEGGTYHRFGADIGRIIKKECGAEIQVRPSQGSLENLGRLRNEPFAQLAIVQQDVLEYVRQSQDRDPTLKEWIEKFKYVVPLHREEVHIIARRDTGLRTLADLAGKRIAVGEPGSGTNLTATLILTQAGLRGSIAEVHMSAREGVLRLLGLEGGPRIDAVFYVAGKPVPLLSGADDLVTLKHLEQLTLVAIPRDHFSRRYGPAELTQAAYPWLDRTVETVSVRAVLVAFDFKGPQCENVAMIARLIKENLEELRQRLGHPKWGDVDLDTAVAGWERYACVATRMTAPIDGCRFLKDAGAPTPGQAIDCRDLCELHEKKRNPLPCMLCQDKSDLLSRRR